MMRRGRALRGTSAMTTPGLLPVDEAPWLKARVPRLKARVPRLNARIPRLNARVPWLNAGKLVPWLQVLYQKEGGRNDPILAAVGQLQFEVGTSNN
eukprot:1812599-Pyramimonas_sp.AAC.1